METKSRSKQKKTSSKPIHLHLLLINCAFWLLTILAFYLSGRNEIITVNTMVLNVRTGPGISYEIKNQVTRGNDLTIIQTKNNWYKVQLPDQSTGWVASWLVNQKNSTANTNITATVNTNQTKLRKSASTESTILKELKKGTSVTISKEEGDWSYVTVSDKHGWILSDLLDMRSSSKIAKSDSGTLYAMQNETNVRQTPDVGGDLVEQVDYGAELKLIAEEDKWYKVETTNGKTGYVASWVVSFANPKESGQHALSSISESTIVIDPGHGGDDVGATALDGTYEKNIALNTAQYLKTQLEKTGAKVVLTRSDDTTVSLSDRPMISNQYKADAFISIHYDSTEGTDVASGTTTYYYHDSDTRLAECINKHLASDLPLPNRGVEYGDFQVTRDNEQPAVLLELGYLNNSTDSGYAVTKSYQKKAAQAINNGLKEYFQE